MRKRIFNSTAWVLLLAGSILASGGFTGPGKDLIVILSASILAGFSVLLFWLGGDTCKSNTPEETGGKQGTQIVS